MLLHRVIRSVHHNIPVLGTCDRHGFTGRNKDHPRTATCARTFCWLRPWSGDVTKLPRRLCECIHEHEHYSPFDIVVAG